MRRKNLKKFRIDLGLKSKEIAEKTGISKEYYSNIELGKSDPSYEYIETFEKTFDVEVIDVWWLFKKVQ